MSSGKVRRGRQRGRGGRPRNHCEKGSCFLQIASGAASGTIVVNPVNFGTRMVSLADVYSQFRFTKMDIEFLRPATNLTALGWVPGPIGTAPTTVANVMQLDHCRISELVSTVPVHLRLNRSSLIGEAAVKWFKTGLTASVDDQGDQQGLLVTAMTTSADLFITIHYVCEFSGDADPGSLPRLEARIARLTAEEREELMERVHRRASSPSLAPIPPGGSCHCGGARC